MKMRGRLWATMAFQTPLEMSNSLVVSSTNSTVTSSSPGMVVW
uniref:Uncharacterized protein n=1 Tax=Arundo donax TaxID=35708 RepID=A0A0A9CM25_ARUDO